MIVHETIWTGTLRLPQCTPDHLFFPPSHSPYHAKFPVLPWTLYWFIFLSFYWANFGEPVFRATLYLSVSVGRFSVTFFIYRRNVLMNSSAFVVSGSWKELYSAASETSGFEILLSFSSIPLHYLLLFIIVSFILTQRSLLGYLLASLFIVISSIERPQLNIKSTILILFIMTGKAACIQQLPPTT